MEDTTHTAQDVAPSRSSRDIAAAALLLAFLALAAAGAVFFTLKTNNGQLLEATTSLEKRISAYDERLAAVEALPETLRRQAALATVEEMSLRARLLTDQAEGEEKEKLDRLNAMLKEIKQVYAE